MKFTITTLRKNLHFIHIFRKDICSLSIEATHNEFVMHASFACSDNILNSRRCKP